jgi:hypothetical protein
MNRIKIQELERSLRLVREVLIDLTDQELELVNQMTQKAGYAIALEAYSRETERQQEELALV